MFSLVVVPGASPCTVFYRLRNAEGDYVSDVGRFGGPPGMTISEAMGVIKTRESLPAGVGQMRVWLVDESKGLSDAFDKAVPFKHVDSIPDDLSEDRYLVVISPPGRRCVFTLQGMFDFPD
jgi:hypothetical protein